MERGHAHVVSVEQLFDACEEFELKTAKLYSDFMIRLGSDDDRIAQFWEEMSSEEWEHYVIVHFGRKLCERAGMMREPVRTVNDATLTELADLLHEHEERVARGAYTLKDAFRMAIIFESSEVDDLFMHLVHVIQQAIERLGEYHLEKRLQRASAHMHEHLDGLVRAIRRLANDPELVRYAREAVATQS